MAEIARLVSILVALAGIAMSAFGAAAVSAHTRQSQIGAICANLNAMPPPFKVRQYKIYRPIDYSLEPCRIDALLFAAHSIRFGGKINSNGNLLPIRPSDADENYVISFSAQNVTWTVQIIEGMTSVPDFLDAPRQLGFEKKIHVPRSARRPELVEYSSKGNSPLRYPVSELFLSDRLRQVAITRDKNIPGDKAHYSASVYMSSEVMIKIHFHHSQILDWDRIVRVVYGAVESCVAKDE